MTVSMQVSLDDDLAALVAARAEFTGLRQDQVVASAIRRGLGGGRLTQILNQARKDTSLSNEEAMNLAIAEQKVVRVEREAS